MSTSRPVIGVPWPRPDYLAALERAGATPRELQPDRDALPDALDDCDGVLLTGGVDVDPIEYGEEKHPTVEIDRTRDEYELAIARRAIERNLPLLAICRGAQVLNVAAGGTLIQDLPSQHTTKLEHSVVHSPDAIAHSLKVTPNTCLSVLLAGGADEGATITVNSRHHQSVKDPAPGFIVSATAEDGVVEAIEKPDADFCLGVQWHPENFWRTGRFSGLFGGLVDAARRQRDRR